MKYLKAKLWYRKIKPHVPRPWQTIPRAASLSGHSYLLFQPESTVVGRKSEFESSWSKDWPSGPYTMSFTFIVMTMLLGSSMVFAFVLLPSEEVSAAPANSPVSQHRSVPTYLFPVSKVQYVWFLRALLVNVLFQEHIFTVLWYLNNITLLFAV